MAVRQREVAVAKYNEHPNICLYCGQPIRLKDGDRVASVRLKKFCDHRCSALYANQARDSKRDYVFGRCAKCNGKTRSRDLRSTVLHCGRCLPHSKRPLKPQTITKGELFAKRSGWQSARTHIRVHAYRVWSRTGQPHSCVMCAYSKHFEVCHIRAVAEFPDSATIQEVNAPSNLLALCPNCHWEFDHGFITKEQLVAQVGIEPTPETL